MARYLSISA
jgi:hypothetical protein